MLQETVGLLQLVREGLELANDETKVLILEPPPLSC
jgi:hypothetical protein